MSSNKSYDISPFDLTLMSAGTGLVLLVVAIIAAALTEIPLILIAIVFILVFHICDLKVNQRYSI